MTHYRVLKRGTDIVVSGALLVLTSPVMLVAGYLVKRHDGGEVLYRARRVGKGGREFTMLKFRTMVMDAESLGGSSTASDDDRITPVGRWMREHKLDELPQLVNVLRGEMSLVGPRPQVGWDVARYTDEERRLLDVAPGVTDWASIAFRNEGEILAAEDDPDEAYDRLIRPEKIRLGLEYVDRVSLRTDISILARTLAVVLGRDAGDHVRYAEITEDWDTVADDQQWALAQQRYSLAAELAPGKDVLEVGCGTGYGLAKLRGVGASVVGIDPDALNIASANEHAPECDFRVGDAQSLELADSSVDLVLGLEMIYYLDDRKAFLGEAARVLRPGGTLLLSFPNEARPGFQPSTFSTSYPDVESITSELSAEGLHAEILGSLPLHQVDPRSERLRRLAVRARLIPRTLKGRARMKRVLGRRMRPLGSIELEPASARDHLTAVDSAEAAAAFGILVVVARLRG